MLLARGWSVPEFLRKPVVTCDFPGVGAGGGGSWEGPAMDPPMTMF